MRSPFNRAAGFATAAFLLVGIASAQADGVVSCTSADNVRLVAGDQDCFALLSFGGDGMRAGGTLVVFLHGDVSSGGPGDAFKRIAAGLTQPGRMTAVLIRQGYNDSEGRISTGEHYGRTDNATPANIDNIGAALDRLKQHHRAGRLVVIGHSRGSNIAGVLLGRRPGLIDAAVLMSCPCDLVARQTQRGRRQGILRSLSPLEFVDRIPPETWIATVTGADDDNTSPQLLKAWHEALARRKLPVRDLVLAGEPHNWSPRWFEREALRALLKQAIGD